MKATVHTKKALLALLVPALMMQQSLAQITEDQEPTVAQNWIVNAGVYNITNVKYIPWETLRQFVGINTNNSVDKDGHGFNRYTAPGRNYAVSLTYEF